MRHHLTFIGVVALLLAGCRKGELKPGSLPDTHLSIEAINLTGPNRLNSEVRLSWYGTDVDGYIKGFEISLDNQNWDFTTVQDSVFIFDLEAGSDTTDIDFYVRAIDDDDNTDPTPAYLKVPLKNSAPSVSISEARSVKDTAFCVSTFYWSASDPDGNQTVKQVFIRFNEGNWTEISVRENLISILVDTSVSSGSAMAKLYYGRNDQPENFDIDGLKVGEQNVLYVKSVDLAGAESAVDTSASFYLKNKKPGADVLWVSAHSKSIAAEYRSLLNSQSVSYDFLDYGSDFGKGQPVYWDPTFKLILGLYPKFFLDAPSSTFPNVVTGQDAVILDYMATIIQDYQSNGGKTFVTTRLDNSLEAQEIAVFADAFGFEDLDRTNSQNSPTFRVRNTDTTFPGPNFGTFPSLSPQNIQIVSPIIKAADSEPFYYSGYDPRPQLKWQGDSLVATVRRNQANEFIQVFFAVELHYFHKSGKPEPVQQLIGRILKDEF